MAITRLSATNFKCFNSLDVSLGRFNVLIGTNAVGKSNFVQIFKFLRDLVQYGADNAISMQGGPEYLANISLGTSQPLSLSITSDREYRFVRGRKNLIGFKIRETVYTLVLHLKKGKLAFDIADDKVAVVCDVFTMGPRNRDTIEEKEKIGEARIQIANLQGKLSVQTDLPQTAGLTEDDIIPKFAVEERRPPNTALLQQHFYFLPFPAPWVFSDIAIYDFDPKLPKKAVPITGKSELEEDGSNLAIILKNLIDNKGR